MASVELAPLFEELLPYLWRVMRRLGVAAADVEDCCQEVFLVAHRRARDFEGRSSARTWLYGIAVRVASEHRRRAWVQRERPTARVPEASAPADQPESVERRQARALLDRALAELDDDRRVAFVLYEIEELALREIAESLDVPLQTVYSRLVSARKDVEAFVRAHASEPAPRRRQGGG